MNNEIDSDIYYTTQTDMKTSHLFYKSNIASLLKLNVES